MRVNYNSIYYFYFRTIPSVPLFSNNTSYYYPAGICPVDNNNINTCCCYCLLVKKEQTPPVSPQKASTSLRVHRSEYSMSRVSWYSLSS